MIETTLQGTTMTKTGDSEELSGRDLTEGGSSKTLKAFRLHRSIHSISSSQSKHLDEISKQSGQQERNEVLL